MTVKLQDDSPTTLSPLEVGAGHPVGAPRSCPIGLQVPSDPHLPSCCRRAAGRLQKNSDYESHLDPCGQQKSLANDPTALPRDVQDLFSGMGGGSDGKESAYNGRDLGSIPGSGRSPAEGNGYPLQHFCLENSMDRRAW